MMHAIAEVARSQMRLLVEIIPYIPTKFALKGSTAINLYHRNFPLYSVDLYLA